MNLRCVRSQKKCFLYLFVIRFLVSLPIIRSTHTLYYIILSFVFTLCSIYAPPNTCIDIKDYEHLLAQIKGQVMILGDFNAHNPRWCSDHKTSKGKVMETFISRNDLCLFNNGSYTFLHSGNGSYSAIDLSFDSPSIFDLFSWDVHDDCCGSDHFPIILTAAEDDNNIKHQRLKI